MIRQIALGVAVLVIATVLFFPRIGGGLWIWLAIAAVVWAVGLAIVRARR